MDNFIVKTDNGAVYITNETAGFIIRVEKNRLLSPGDKGAIIIATLYREASGFEQVCDYIFEAVNPAVAVDASLLQQAVKYFFTCYLNTTYYVKTIPVCSSLYTGAIFADHAAVVCQSV
ncbi:hypothetical protein [Mucilaginibacter gotjawali]|uniref:Uncharacterized protein n=2 Tax=Mucilaginibacter gotjawali TaxID=1550579 RepID=A0A0X8X0G4_9SPHI|nr:hypothetical protein [Mucilaginibacter gotjawali]MBB3056113.1 hypothetical protein [Mucilaginibacter gotjawali]BAU53550.1 hypothetical protein MgSA37_01719 [Mucilaginibacter gotjawali]